MHEEFADGFHLKNQLRHAPGLPGLKRFHPGATHGLAFLHAAVCAGKPD
jgi:hypothetical protein